MRVTVVRTEGVPDGCILSVKAGDQRRQMPLSSEGQSLCFDNTRATELQPLRLDLLDPLASCCRSLTAGEHIFEVRSNQGHPMRLVLRLEDFVDRPAGSHALGPEALPRQTSANLGATVGSCGKHSAEKSNGLFGDREAKIAADAHYYLEHHKLLQAMRAGLSRVLRERPAAPHEMLAQEILRLNGASTGEPFVASAGTADGAVVPESTAGYPHGTVAAARAQAAMPPLQQQLTMDLDMFLPPALPRGLPLRILDLGSGEVGFYAYGAKGNSKCAKQIGDKMKGGFLCDWVEPQKSAEFAEEIMRRYGVTPSPERREIVFVAGATGVNREALQKDQKTRESVRAFTRAVEAHLNRSLGGCRCYIRMFVPSGSLEAEYELRAVEWLLEQCSASDPSLGPGVHSAFVGTISAGGGSAQVSVRGGSGTEAVQLFSMPLGNRKPILAKLLSTPPAEAEVGAWVEMVSKALTEETFPQSLRGLFVGISATFYAAKEANIAGRVVSKAEAIDAFNARIAECTGASMTGQDGGAAARSAANVALVRCLLDWVLHEDAQILFRRNWKVNGDETAATWTLGMYAEAEVAMLREVDCSPIARPASSDSSPTRESMRKAAKSLIAQRRLAQLEHRKSFKAEPGGPFFHVPLAVNETGPSLLLDIGHVAGFYVLQVDAVFQTVSCKVASSCEAPFQETFLAGNRDEAFATEIVTRFNLESNDRLDPVHVTCGITGDYSLHLLSDAEARRRVGDFFCAVQCRLQERLRRHVSVDVFVPSPDFAAKLELSAAEWLMNMFPSPSSSREEFVGTLSVTSTEARLALRAPSGRALRSKQVYSVELSPDMDVATTRSFLASAAFPRGLQGLFLVTAEEACKAAEAAGVAAGHVLARNAADALARRALDPHIGDRSGLESMIAEVLRWTLEGGDSRVLFRHAWHVGEVTGCAPLWALGLLTSQIEDEGALAAIAAARLESSGSFDA
mmetsp:Transcript_27108/g.75585  ORF Transcript_27108/g.75585 Transcript_27108/m.75585 type:complete len:967 (-) Transcript_27108:125-3025(-)